MSNEYLDKQEYLDFFRYLCIGVEEAALRERYNVLGGWIEWHGKIEPVLRGAALVTIISNVEQLIGKKSDGSWDIPDDWYGKEELKCFQIICDCWAKVAGRIPSDKEKELEQYLTRFKNSKFFNRQGDVIRPYFYFQNDKVILERPGLHRAKLLCIELLAEKGLVNKWW